MKIAVYTCITNSYDEISTPFSNSSGVDFICFNDGSIRVPEPWDNVKINFSHIGRNANRYIKILPHLNEKLKNYDLTIYIDGSIQVVGDLTPLIQQVQSADGGTFMYEHPDRNCIYLEARACVESMKAPFAETSKLLARYRKKGMPQAFGLFEGGIIIRKRGLEFERLMEAWWRTYIDGVGRDQIALMYSSWETGMSIYSLGKPDHRFDRRYFYCKPGHKGDFIKRHFAWWIWRPIIRVMIRLKIISL